MGPAYVDTSCLVAVAFTEPGGTKLARRLETFQPLLSSNLLEAELRSAVAREGAEGVDHFFTWLTWILPDRPLGGEIAAVLNAGYARGADAWHLANALYVAEEPGTLPFLTLDGRQEEIARKLGFPTPL